MPQRYGTRSATKAARSRVAIAGKARVSEQSSSSTAAVRLVGSSGHTPEAAAGLPPRTNNGRRQLTAPSPFHLEADGGQQRGQESTPAALHLPGKRALVRNSTVPSPAAISVSTTAGAAQVGAENHPPSGAESRRKRSRLSLGFSRRRVSTPQQTVAAPAVLAPICDGSGKSGSIGAVVGCFPGGISPRLTEGWADSVERPRNTSLPPPFVGLKNLGETCYVNAVLQALAACRASLKSGRGSSAAAADAGKTGDPQGEDKRLGSSSATPVHVAEDVEVSSVGTASTGVRAGADGNPVFLALGKVLGEMEERNRNMSQQQQQQQQSPALPMRPSDQTPCRPGVPERENDGYAGAIAPDDLVELVREGWLSAERSAWGVNRSLFRRLGGGTAGMGGDFGNGQACVSELHGKLLDVCTATAAAGAVKGRRGGSRLGDVSSGSVSGWGSDSGVCGLATAFRGTLCARTHCVECERDRTSREEFTELTLPPFVKQPPPQPPSSKRAAAAPGAVAAENTSDSDLSKPQQQQNQTLQSLVDAMLGRESLEGDNKVWCSCCRQWNEAERRSSLCSPPALLTLHVRPGTRKQSSPCSYPATAIVAAGGAFREEPDGAGGADGRGGPCGMEQALTAHGEHGELIERVLVVKSAMRCRSHVAEASGSGSASSAQNQEFRPPRLAAKGEKGHRHRQQGGKQHRQRPSELGDVFYDLVGVILHQGQTLGSGHYTFVLHAGGPPSRLGGQPPACHRHRLPYTEDRSSPSGGTGYSAPSAGTDREIPDTSDLVQGLIGGSEPSGSVAGGASCKKPGFALFDDDVVRWLSLEEQSLVLRGGGGAIGDPFLVFYARRE